LRSGLTRFANKTQSSTGLKNDPLTVLLFGTVLDDGNVPAQDHLHGLHSPRSAERGKQSMYIGGIGFAIADLENESPTDS
jgi:hypothetical protein